MVTKVFISHDSEDAQFAHRLANDLQRLGVQVWIAPESILPGENWVDAIERGLSESSHVLVVLTTAALESKWVKMETNVAIALERQGRIHVIPLDVKPCTVPLMLGSYQMVSFGRVYDVGLSQLVSMLGLHDAPSGLACPPLQHVGVLGPEMIHIPAGEFFMGSDPSVDKCAEDNEQPQHTVYLPNYYLAQTPVTNAQYAAFVQATGHRLPSHWQGGRLPIGKDDHPVVHISWRDALAYCRWLTEATGKPYRLPSEAEWEKGARGIDGRIYPWGNEWDAKRLNSFEGGRGDTSPVGVYVEGASPYGLLDMAGNVWEWTRSKWGRVFEDLDYRYPYDPTDGRDELDGLDRRVLRGGAWYYKCEYQRCACRSRSNPDFRPDRYGFRVALDDLPPP